MSLYRLPVNPPLRLEQLSETQERILDNECESFRRNCLNLLESRTGENNALSQRQISKWCGSTD